MGPLTLLIKPASGSCNMRCKYCFYADEAENREVASYGMMSDATLEAVVRFGLENARGVCTFAFQGGEPTLAGLDFYRRLVAMQRAHNTRGLRVYNTIQTNGYLIDREWADFLARERFLTGLSLDGGKDVHDLYRVDARGEGTFARVMRAAQTLAAAGAEFNILTVVTAQTARSIGKIYGFFKRNHFRYQQYIACLDPIGAVRGGMPYSLTPKLYGEFLCKLFDLWYADFMRGEYVSIRWFDDLVHMCKGRAPQSCGMRGVCGPQIVIEADGGVYPCDFYVLDGLRLGTVGENTLEEMEQRRTALAFIEQSRPVEEKCRACRWYPLCRGGCRRDREQPDGSIGLNYFCESYEAFFAHCADRLMQVSRMVR